MTRHTTYAADDLDTILADDLVSEAARLLGADQGGSVTHAYDADGDLAGLVYYADETRTHYAADLDDCKALLLLQIEAQNEHGEDGDERRACVYSVWCSSTSLCSGETVDAAADAAGWTV